MDPRPLAFFASACQGEVACVSPDLVIYRVSTDSRATQPGDLFVAIEGERVDGHDFVADALRRGAVAAVVARSRLDRFPDTPRLSVANPRQALARMAAEYRAGFRLPVIAVGGSNGKTTTKDLIGSVLGSCFETLRSPESYNNDIGVPATLLSLESRHVAAVIEVGTNHPGELAPLVRLALPRLGVLTQIGEEHLEFFGSMAGVIEEEGTLADFLPPDGALFIPCDEGWSEAIVQRTRARVIRIGRGNGSDWRLLEAETDTQGSTFSIRAPRPELSGEYRVNLLGQHQVSNALLACAVASEFGLGRDEIRRGLLECKPARWRMNRWQWNGVEIIEDCYNANLDSTLAALETLRAFPCAGRRVFVLGGMAELGGHTVRAHEAVGRRAAELAIDRLVAVGDPASVSAETAAEQGMAHAMVVDSLATATASLRAFLRPGDCLLIKGSRAARLERLGRMLRDPMHLEYAA